MYNDMSNPGVFNCTFTDNSASGHGGGIYNYTSDPGVFNCTFNYNTCGENGGAISSGYWCFPGVGNCKFIGNSATNGGGIWQELGTLWVTNCIFSGNSATNGGGIYNYAYGTSIMTYCSFSGNSASNSGGGLCGYFYEGPDYDMVKNCIFWGNTAPAGAQIYNVTTPIDVNFSDIQGGWAGTGNIEADPLFADANGPDGIIGTEDDNLRLLPDSPCIDSGDNNYIPDIDLDGRNRPADGDCNATIIVDMGAYEFTSAYFGDFDSDCDVDFSDYSIQAGFWLTDELLVDIAPTPAGDGIVDIYDLAILCENWLSEK
jgi:predicted outer membrane repeat protein